MKKTLRINGEEREVTLTKWDENSLEMDYKGKRYQFTRNGEDIILQGSSTKAASFTVLPSEKVQVFAGELEAEIEFIDKAQKASGVHGGAGSLQSPMPGKIFKVLKEEGEEVKLGDAVLILEAMKMEHTIKAQQDGVVKKIHFEEGAQVQGGVELCEIE